MVTSHGWYSSTDPHLGVNKWIRVIMVYDPKSATGDAVDKLFADNQMYPLTQRDTHNYSQHTGEMVLGRNYLRENYDYGNALFDDLKMWNRKLSDKEMFAMSR